MVTQTHCYSITLCSLCVFSDIVVGFDQTHYSVCDESTIKLCMNALSGVEPMTDLVLAVELGYKGGG